MKATRLDLLDVPGRDSFMAGVEQRLRDESEWGGGEGVNRSIGSGQTLAVVE